MLEKSEIRFLPLGARRVAYEIRGDGPPLVAPAWWVSHLELDWQSAGFRRFWEGVAGRPAPALLLAGVQASRAHGKVMPAA
jgi:hypothetical protein